LGSIMIQPVKSAFRTGIHSASQFCIGALRSPTVSSWIAKELPQPNQKTTHDDSFLKNIANDTGVKIATDALYGTSLVQSTSAKILGPLKDSADTFTQWVYSHENPLMHILLPEFIFGKIDSLNENQQEQILQTSGIWDFIRSPLVTL